MSDSVRVLSLQPYFGGSHAQFHDNWTKRSRHQWTTLTLPSRHWKWRMRHASLYFAKEIKALVARGEIWDVIFCSDMLNVAEFKGLAAADGALRQVVSGLPIVMYFHENQFAYPTRPGFKPDQHFPFTNFISAIIADRIWFNSRFNFDSMMAGLNRHSKRWPDFVPESEMQSLMPRVEVEPPGIAPPLADVKFFLKSRIARAKANEPMRIVWASRWEHDKNAEDFFSALKLIQQKGIPFQLSVLGQSYPNSPKVFAESKTAFASQILRWGFQESREQYWEALAESDLFVTTANHEFFGIAAAEAVAVGLKPLFPNRLAYPELLAYGSGGSAFETQCLFDGSVEGLATSLNSFHDLRKSQTWLPDLTMSSRLMERLSWDRRAVELDLALVASDEKTS